MTGDVERDVPAGARGHAVLTVVELRDVLEDRPDGEVVVVYADGWYQNVESVTIPGDDPETSDYQALTLNLGEAYDTRFDQ